MIFIVFFFQAEDGIRDLVRSRGLGDVYKRQSMRTAPNNGHYTPVTYKGAFKGKNWAADWTALGEYGYISTYNAGAVSYTHLTPVSYTHLTLPTSDLV